MERSPLLKRYDIEKYTTTSIFGIFFLSENELKEKGKNCITAKL